jgi:Fe-S oxidoreductase
MCPTFIAIGEEIMSTRGRANAIRAALELRGVNGDPLRSKELEAALSNCLSCKACTNECPSNVNLALLKAELQHARIHRDGLTLRERVFSNVDRLGRIACTMPRLANWLLELAPMRTLSSKFLGLSTERPLPRYTKIRFDRWFARRQTTTAAHRGRLVLWDDTFVRYHDPHIGMAAVKVLDAAGFQVTLATQRRCCGRPAFSQGNLDEAARLGQHNLALLSRDADDAPIIFLEPSCYAMFAEDYRELKLPNAAHVAKRCFLFEEFVANLLSREPHAIQFHPKPARLVIHMHCHAKALTNTGYMQRLAAHFPEWTVTVLDTGCCGMAGGFGMLESKYELSVKVAEPLIRQIKALPFGNIIVASGTSCRHQIQDLGNKWPRHMAEVLAEVLV